MILWLKSINPDLPENPKSEVEALISILLPVFNAENTLEKCLQSIQGQTYTHFEVVVVDDGSADQTSTILSQFAQQDPRIQIFPLLKNAGIVNALNEGLKHCQGKWVARMDADDLMYPDRLEKQLLYMQQHSDVDILGARIKLFRTDAELTAGQIQYQDWSNSLIEDEEIKAEMFAESPMMHPTFFLKKSFYVKMGGYQDNPWAEDYDFLLRAYSENARFAKLEQVLVDKGDSPTRVSRVDKRCKRKAMFHAKVHYFTRNFPLKEKSELIIIGSGSSGQHVNSALKKDNIKVDAFVNNVKNNKTTLSGIPVISLTSSDADSFFLAHRNAFFILCIGMNEGRQQVEKLLKKYQFAAEKDYLRFI